MVSSTYVRGIETISTIAEKDSYVSDAVYNDNDGGKEWLIIGNYDNNYWWETYLYFNFTDKPVGWTKAEIWIVMFSVSETFDVAVSLINDIWGEYTIEWLNKPNHAELITTFTVDEGYFYTTIDVTNHIEGDGISICLNASDYLQTGYALAYSRERLGYINFGGNHVRVSPQLIWTYDTSITTTTIVGYDLLILLGVTIIIGLILIKKERRI
jgi:hypothetical protein